MGNHANDGVKTVAVWVGVAALTAVGLAFQPSQTALSAYSESTWWLLIGLAVAIGTVTYAVQYGVARIPASQASVIFLFELIIAAMAAYFLTQERLEWHEWVGAGMILTASLFSGRMQHG